jgi:hypothetical protein
MLAMESFLDLIIEFAQFLDGGPELEDFWAWRQTFTVGLTCLLALINSRAIGASQGLVYHGLASIQIRPINSLAVEGCGGPSRHTPFHQSYSAMGYQSIEPLSLSSRTIS